VAATGFFLDVDGTLIPFGPGAGPVVMQLTVV
jgi:hypothetical protein